MILHPPLLELSNAQDYCRALQRLHSPRRNPCFASRLAHSKKENRKVSPFEKFHNYSLSGRKRLIKTTNEERIARQILGTG